MQSVLQNMTFGFAIRTPLVTSRACCAKTILFNRQRLLLVLQQLHQPITDQHGFIDIDLQVLLARICQASMKAIKNDLEAADKQISEFIQSNGRLKELFECIASVPRIGLAIAAEVLVATDEF